MNHRRKKVAVGLSGGVDSSVAAWLIREEGYAVVGVTMEIFDGPEMVVAPGRHACYGPGEKEDVETAAAVCERLGIPFYTVDLRKEYREHVIDYFRREYLAGRTPNPCVVCNRRLKFGFLLERARAAGADFDLFATGHYARVVEENHRFLLKRALDAKKDQSYFLYALRPAQLSRALFPLGNYRKRRVVEWARSLGLVTAERCESQDFVAGGDYGAFFGLEDMQAGDIVDEEGNVLGRHRGIIHYTVGQRRGLGISAPHPLYVVRIDAEQNRLVVGGRERLLSKELIAADLNLIAVDRLEGPLRIKAKIRLQHEAAEATLFSHEGGRARVLFDRPQMSVTPGQSAVFYSKGTVLGGGVIERVM